MASFCKVLLLATSDSVGFASEVAAAGPTTRLLRSIGSPDTACVATAPVDGKPVLTRWTDTIRGCPRLLPLESKVFVATSEENRAAVQAWAKSAGFPEANIVSTGAPSGAGCAAAEGVAAYLTGDDRPPGRASGRGTLPHRCGWLGNQMLGPLAVLRKASVHELASMADAGLPPRAQLAEFCRQKLQAGPVYALPLGTCFSVESLDTYLFTHSFFEWYRQQKQSMAAQPLRVEDSNIFLAEDTRLGGDVTSKLDRQLELLETVAKKGQIPWSSRLDLGPMIHTFMTVYERRQKEAAMRPEPTLPDRFMQPETWKYRTARKEHPVFTTSNNIYGAKVPVQPQMPNSYHGLNGQFTKGF
eukprot:CAMPEP_0177796680 /NCGR_PEP_ID=MMETSP0491_2-20121128/26903_1 /TAXON_ID=63592 /ORGANISM="Tetraselmis chuii, Strain PLY429" /LENGTH=356 /DNA_ID=CAMNT_0019319609 /DNA_START=65 /DNA_END=1133 /DNA_ORIENTATION=+